MAGLLDMLGAQSQQPQSQNTLQIPQAYPSQSQNTLEIPQQMMAGSNNTMELPQIYHALSQASPATLKHVHQLLTHHLYGPPPSVKSQMKQWNQPQTAPGNVVNPVDAMGNRG